METYDYILAIKPEFLQTKIGIYNQDGLLFLKSIVHQASDLKRFNENTDQFEFRGDAIINEIHKADIDLASIKIIVARGGLLKPISSGIYAVNDAMKRDLRNSPVGRHSVNIGGLLADYIASKIQDAKAYIADPAVVDELDEIARYTGLPDIKRKSVFHALNHKYVARQFAHSVQKPYEEMNLIVAHMGDGISIGAHKKGKVVDVNQCFDGEGPFSLERSGSIPMVDLIKMCFSGKYTQEELLLLIRNQGGIAAYLGTNNYHHLEYALKENNTQTLEIFQAMAYQVSKYIGSMAPVFCAPVDYILLTGVLANNPWFIEHILERVRFIAPVHIYPGEDVLDALATNGLRILNGDSVGLEYR